MTVHSRYFTHFAAVAVLVASLTAPPAGAKGSERCPKFKPVAPRTESERAKEAPNLPITRITDAATKKNPVVIEFDQEASVYWYAHMGGRGPIIDGNEYFNVQVDTDKRVVGLHARLEWARLPEELDLYMYSSGSIVAWSEAFNQIPAEVSGDTGGPGYEYIAGYPAGDCAGFTIEDNAMWTTPQKVQLKLWLGPMTFNY